MSRRSSLCVGCLTTLMLRFEAAHKPASKKLILALIDHHHVAGRGITPNSWTSIWTPFWTPNGLNRIVKNSFAIALSFDESKSQFTLEMRREIGRKPLMRWHHRMRS
jgi:hypothetical protein